MKPCRDWSALSSDILVQIAVRVPLVEDFMAFRGVCSSWRVAASKDKFKPPRRSVPLLMLPWKNDNDEREFYSLSRWKISMRAPLPEARDKRCLEVGFGWILTIASSGDVNLLNPFSRAQIQLPSIGMSLIFTNHLSFIARAVLSSDPSNTSNYVLLVIFSNTSWLGFWRVGDKLWNAIETYLPFHWFADIACYKEKFYAVDDRATYIWVWDPLEHPYPDRAEKMFEVHFPFKVRPDRDIYLVESSNGELLLITPHFKDVTREDKGRAVPVMRLDVIKHQGEVIAGLGNDAVFVGANASTSVAASAFPDLVEPNRIYFAMYSSPRRVVSPDGEDKKMGIYNVEDGSIEWLVTDEPPNRICPPVWIVPSF